MKRIELEINKFLGEKNENIIEAIRTKENIVIDSPCGTGKTRTTVGILRQQQRPFILLVPNKVVKLQVANTYNLASTIEGISLTKLIEIGKKEIICCYESLRNLTNLTLLKDFVIVIDEAHKILLESHFRNNTNIFMKSSENQVIILSATLDNQIKDNYINGLRLQHYLKFIKLGDGIKVEVRELDPNNHKKKNWRDFEKVWLNQLKKQYSHILYITSKNYKYYENAIHSENVQHHETYKSIVEDKMLPPGLTVSTNLFNEGIDLLNDGVIALLINYSSFDIQPENYIQLIARFRKAKKVVVYIYKSEKVYFKQSTESIYNQLQKYANRMNKDDKLAGILFSEIPTIRTALEFVNQEWRVNPQGLDNVMFLVNGYKKTTKEIIEQLPKDFEKLEPISIQSEIAQKVEVKATRQHKSIMKELFLNESKDDLNDFCINYFEFRSGKYSLKNLKTNYTKELEGLLFYMADNKPFRKALEKLIDKNKISPGYINKYFSICKEKSLTDKEIKAIKDYCLSIKVDNRRFKDTRKFMTKELKIQWFPNTASLYNDSKLLKLLKEEVGIKVTTTEGGKNRVFTEK